MSLLTDEEHRLLEQVSRLAYGNPFLPERIECERAILGDAWIPSGQTWHAREDVAGAPNVEQIQEVVEETAARLARRLEQGASPTAGESSLHRDLEVYRIYHRYEKDFLQLTLEEAHGTRKVSFYRRFVADCDKAAGLEPDLDVEHLFACFFQVRRAFHLVFRALLGGSMPAARLRAAVWQSVFTRDARRYRRSLYRRLGDVTTLITGPSGTGKELVARAVGMSRYIPFDSDRAVFAEDFESSFYPLNLTALSPTLIESELFGHRRGAFTGAIDDRVGWFEVCPPLGTVLLDEIGEVESEIQVKLLRVLETRRFQRLGDTQDRHFQGKVIAATNRDLAREVERGRMRLDLYYRLCSDLIETVSLREQLQEAPEELHNLVLHLARKIAGEEEAEGLADEVVRWIESELGMNYSWPGNVRELEQCVRNVMIRGEYRPRKASTSELQDLQSRILAGSLRLDELETAYVTLVYSREGTYTGTASKLGLDRRTVKAKVDPDLLARLRFSAGHTPSTASS